MQVDLLTHQIFILSSKMNLKSIYCLIKNVSNVLIKFYSSKLKGWSCDQVSSLPIYIQSSMLENIYNLPCNYKFLYPKLQKYFLITISPSPGFIHILKNFYVSGRGVVFKNFQLFYPSLHHNTALFFQNTFLLKQWTSKKNHCR